MGPSACAAAHGDGTQIHYHHLIRRSASRHTAVYSVNRKCAVSACRCNIGRADVGESRKSGQRQGRLRLRYVVGWLSVMCEAQRNNNNMLGFAHNASPTYANCLNPLFSKNTASSNSDTQHALAICNYKLASLAILKIHAVNTGNGGDGNKAGR